MLAPPALPKALCNIQLVVPTLCNTPPPPPSGPSDSVSLSKHALESPCDIPDLASNPDTPDHPPCPPPSHPPPPAAPPSSPLPPKQVPVIQLLGHVWRTLLESDTTTVAAPPATAAVSFGGAAAAAAVRGDSGFQVPSAALPGMLAYLSGEYEECRRGVEGMRGWRGGGVVVDGGE